MATTQLLMFLRLFYITTILLLSIITKAQDFDSDQLTSYSTANGLSHNFISDIKQDSIGYIWIATAAGLNRFNGHQFVQFHTSSDSLSLPAEELNMAQWLDRERLGILSSGLHIVNTRTGKTQNIFIPYHNKKYQFKFNMMMDVKGDEEGNIYVLTRSGFYHFDKNQKLISRFDYFSDEEVPLHHFYFGSGLYHLDQMRYLIVSVAGLYIYDKRIKKVNKMKPEDNPLLAEFLDYNSSRNYQFFQPSENSLLILKSSSDSIVYIDLDMKKKTISHSPFKSHSKEFAWRTRLFRISDTSFYLTGQISGFYRINIHPPSGKVSLISKKYMPNYLCNSILLDRDHELWIGTNRGLFRTSPQKSLVQSASFPEGLENKFPNVRIYDFQTYGDQLFVATHEAGLLVYDRNTMRFQKQLLPNQGKGSNHIRSIVPAKPSTLLLGTNGPLFLYHIKTGKLERLLPPKWDLQGDWTSDLYRDSRSNIWISAFHIYQYHVPSNKFTIVPLYEKLLDVPVALTEDKEGQIWLACHGLAQYNATKNRYDLYLDSFPFIKMPDKQVTSLAVDRLNTLWFNTNNNGLVAFDKSQSSYRHFTKKDGLPDDNIASLLAVGDKVWIASYSGLACIDISTSKILSFGREDGFPAMPIVKGTRLYYDSVAQQLYVGFAGAFSRFHPASMLHKKEAPGIFIENLVVNNKGQYYLPGDSLSTSWKSGEIQITIGTINFSDGHTQGFAYRLANDPGNPWIDIGSQPTFSISSLAPGQHRIQLKTYSYNHRWPEQVKEIYIQVMPPLWRKTWFMILAGIMVMAMIFGFVKWRTGIVRRKEKEKTHLETLKADHYKNQYELEQITNYFSSSLSGKNTVDEVLWDVAQNLIGRMDYEDCVIYLWNDEKTRMVQKAAWGPKGKPEVISADGFEVSPGQGIVGRVITTGQPILVNDTRKDDRYRVDDEFRLSEVAVPIIHNDEILGVIDSENSKIDYFSERDIKILTTIATLIGNKIKQIESELSLEDKQKELAGINEQLIEARLSALQAQMNPHFVFNALNSIKRMILDGDNETASRYLSKFALMIRMTLEHSRQVFVTLDENIEYLKAYLDMEKLRFDGSFTYEIITDENVDTTETVLPSMMIQPIVENAIWHGLMHASGDKRICIHFSQKENSVICTVEDNGIGIHQSEKMKEKQRPLHKSAGLENLRKRLKIMNEKYHTDCSLQITDINETGMGGCGTRVTLEFHLINS